MAARDKIDELYDALMLDGAVTKSRDNFRDYVNDENNRRKLYDALKADGAVTSNTFDEFSNKLGFNAPAERSYSPQGVSTMDDVPQDIAGVRGNGMKARVGGLGGDSAGATTQGQGQPARSAGMANEQPKGQYSDGPSNARLNEPIIHRRDSGEVVGGSIIRNAGKGNASIITWELPESNKQGVAPGEPGVLDDESAQRRAGYMSAMESYYDDFDYTPNKYGEIRFGWRRGARVKPLSYEGLQLMSRGKSEDEEYKTAVAKAETMSDAQLQSEFNRLSSTVKDLRAFVEGDPVGARELGSELKAYAYELRARDLGYSHAKDLEGMSNGEMRYQAGMTEPAVRSQIQQLEGMSDAQRNAALREAYSKLEELRLTNNADPAAIRATEARLLAGALIYGRGTDNLPEKSYEQMLHQVLGTGTVEGAQADVERIEGLLQQRINAVVPDWMKKGLAFGQAVAGPLNPLSYSVFTSLPYAYVQDPQVRMYYAALSKAQEREKMYRMRDEQWGFWHTLVDGLIDSGTWDASANELLNAFTMYQNVGRTYSDAGQAAAAGTMMDAYAQLSEAKQGYQYTDDQSYAMMTYEMLPFMLQFALTGGYSGIGKAAGKIATKAAVKMGMDEVGQFVLRNLGVVAGDFAAGWAMANTVGAAKTWGDILTNATGDTTIRMPDGTFVTGHVVPTGDGNYSFVEGGLGWGKSIYRGQMANTIENFSELLGSSVFDKALGRWVYPSMGRWAGSAADWLGTGELLKAFNRISYSKAMDISRRMLSRVEVQGYPAEVLEEEAGMFLNALLGTGENDFGDMLDADKQRELAVGMFVSMGFLWSPGIVGGTWDTVQYYRYQHKLDKANQNCDYRFSAEGDWEGWRERIDGTANEAMPNLIKELTDDKTLSTDEKRAALEYVKTLCTFRGYNMLTNAKAREEAMKFDGQGNHVAPDNSAKSGEVAYAEGYEADETDRMEIKDLYDLRRHQLAEFVSDDMMAQFDADPIAALATIKDNEQWTDEEKATAIAYINAKAKYDGMMARVEDDADMQVDAASSAIDSHVWRDGDAENPVVITGTMKNGGKQVYIISGNVATFDDGTVDHDGSSESIIYMDEAGNVNMCAPGDFATVDEPMSATELKEQSASDIRTAADTQANTSMNGEFTYNEGDTYNVQFEGDDAVHSVQVVADNGESVAVLADGASEPIEMKKAQIQADAARARQSLLAERDNVGEVPGMVPGSNESNGTDAQQGDLPGDAQGVPENVEFRQDDQVTVEVDGRRVSGRVTHDVDDNGNVEVNFDEPVNGQVVVEMKPEELAGMAVSYTPREAATQAAAPSPGTTTPPAPAPGAAAAPGAAVPQQGRQAQQAQPMPMKEVNGKQVPDFDAASAEQSHDYLYGEGSPYAEAVADKVVDNTVAKREQQVAEAQATYDALKDSEPVIDENASIDDIEAINEAMASNEAAKAEAAQALETAQRELQKWQDVKQMREAQKAAAAPGVVPVAGTAMPGTGGAAAQQQHTEPAAGAPVAPVAGAAVPGAPEATAAPSAETPAEGDEQTTPEMSMTQPLMPGMPVEGAPQAEAEVDEDTAKAAAKAQRIAEKRARIKKRVRELAEACGVPSHVIESEEDLANYPKYIRDAVLAQLKAGNMVHGFYDPRTGHMFYYMPGVASLAEADRIYSHETVAHGGLRELLRDKETGSTEAFDQLCDQVWEMMSLPARIRWMDYVKMTQGKQFEANGGNTSQSNKRMAADEFMAHLSDGRQAMRRNVLRRILNAIRDAISKFFGKKGIKLSSIKTDEDIMRLLSMSRRNLTEMDKSAINQQIGDALDTDTDTEEESAAQTSQVRMSTTSIIEGAGFEVKQFNDAGELVPMSDEAGNVVAKFGGKEFSVHNPVTAKDLEGNKDSVLTMIIDDALASKLITSKKAKNLYKKYAELINMYLTVGSAELGGVDALESNWEWLGDTVYRTIAANGDAQYSYSMDIIKVCKKNEAVIKAISAFQREVRRGATPSDIVDLYRKAYAEGYQVPCPVCYVFTRYIRNGKYASAAIKGMRDYGEHLKGGNDVWTVKQWVAELDRLNRATNPDYKPDGVHKMEGEELEQAKRFDNALEKAGKITLYYENRINGLSFELTKGCTPEREAEILKEIEIMDEQYQWAVDIIAHQALTNWIKTFAIEEKDNKWQLREDTVKPTDMEDFENNALDLRLTSNTMVNYPAIQRLRRSGGSAAGKEITFASNNELGEVISGLGISKTNLNDYPNFWQLAAQETDPKQKKVWRKKAKQRLEDAAVYAAMQTLRGGQRMWSWSDNIERLAPDIAINIMQLEILGGAMQTYSKQLEGIKLTAQMGAYVNGSLMAKDNGWQEVSRDDVEERDGRLWLKKEITDEIEEPQVGGGTQKRKRVIAGKGAHVYQAKDGKLYTLIFDDVVGVDPFGNYEVTYYDKDDVKHEHPKKRKAKGLFDLNHEYDKAGNILVGMNDLHVLAAMADPNVYFIIPWHASGANNHILAQMLSVLGQVMEGQTDYTSMQEEKNMGERNKDTKKLPEINQRLRDLWEAARVEAKANGWTSGMEVDSNGNELTEGQYMYRKLRSLIFNGYIFEKMPTEGEYRNAVREESELGEAIAELTAQREATEDANEKKRLKNRIDALKRKRNQASHIMELHDGLIDWRDDAVHTSDSEEDVAWREAHPKRINLKEARKMIEADHFLSQVMRRVEPIGHMTNGDNTFVYPYEYWDESSTYKTADINGRRYVEYCRRLGYRPKFSGDWKAGNFETGNFVNEPGYWKLLIDRRMYDREDNYQWLDPVDSENFESDLVNPRETQQEFHVTTVADDKGAEDIAQDVYKEQGERGTGKVVSVDYEKSLPQVLDGFEASMEKGVQKSPLLWSVSPEGVMEENVKDGIRFSTSEQIASRYPNWMDNQVITDEDSKKGQQTQVAGTLGTYKKVGAWIEENLGKDVAVLDASSGMGLGTQELRQNGFNIEDIEPYPSGVRMKNNPPTYSGVNAYAEAKEDGKKYDFIISNAVLNVIPDDWRRSVLHDMADLLDVGGKMFINTRKTSEVKGIKNKIELESPNEVLVGTPDKITSYQRFFTPKELKEYVEGELGDGYTVEVANMKNSGTSGLSAVVVTKTAEGPLFSLSPEYRKRSFEDMDSGKVPLNGNLNPEEGDGKFEVIDDENKIFKNWRGTIQRRHKDYNVGKPMDGVYFHKNYAEDIVPKNILDKAREIAEREGFDYNCMYYNLKKPDVVRFDEAPDFDTAREPITGYYLTVDTSTGEAKRSKNRSSQIWHNKWMWVKDDYKGFDVDEAYEWSKTWNKRISNPDGLADKWEYLLTKAGLPIDWSGSALESNSGVLFSFSPNKVDFDNTRNRAVAKRGIVMPGLNESEIVIVNVPRHDFTGTGKQAIQKARKWAEDWLYGEHTAHEGTSEEFRYNIDEDSVDKFLSASSTTNSENLGVHLAVLKELISIINESLDTEIHPDYKKVGKKRSAANGIDNPNLLIHRMYGAIEIDGEIRRVKITMEEYRDSENHAYDYRVTKIGLPISGSATTNALGKPIISAANLLHGVEKSYDPGKKLLDESAKTTENGGPLMMSVTPAPTFYSNAERAVENVKQEKAKAEQWKAMLTKAGGIKAGEDKWMGLSAWLDEHKGESLTKEDVLQFVRENGIQMEEREYGSVTDAPEFYKLQDEYLDILNDVNKVFEAANKRFADYVGKMEEKYGENYYNQMTPQENMIYQRLARDQEEADPFTNDAVDIAMREMTDRYGDDFGLAFSGDFNGLSVAEAEAAENFVGGTLGINTTRLKYTTKGLDNKREIAFVVPIVEPYQENDDVHFGPENEGKAVMWVRFGETTDVDGNRVLVIDEIQSNRHQAGREKGYKNADMQNAFEEYRRQMEDKYFEGRRPINFFNLLKKVATSEEVERYKELSSGYNRSGVPNAPFEKNWHEVAMKRMLRLAAEEGFDKVAWTTGAQQAKRYNLGTVVKSISAAITQDGERVLLIFPKGGGTIDITHDENGQILKMNDKASELFPEAKNISEIVGKSIADEALAINGKGTTNGKKWEDSGLVFGGEGMKGFYDQMLPRFMDKYGKKWGVKTGEVTLDTPGKEVMHSVDVTPEMKESVMQGQPLFSLSRDGDFADVVKDLEEDGISIDNEKLLKGYGLKNVTLSKKGNHVTLTHFIANEQGKGNGTRFMNDLTTLADENGWTLALTPDDSFGATSVIRLKNFYKGFGFKDNKGKNTDFETRESMVRQPSGQPLFSSSGWELFPEDKDAHFEAVAEAVKVLCNKYHLACNVIFSDTSNLSVEDYARNIGEKDYYDSLSDDKKREYAEAFEKSRKGSGEYSPISKNVIIFALNNKSFNELEGTLFHENIHKWLDKNLSDDEYFRLTDGIWANAVDKGLFVGTRSFIEDEYKDKEEDWPEELIAYRMEWGMMSGRLKSIWRLFSMVDNGSELFERILNDIGYDRQREKEERRTRAEENSTQAGGTLRRNSSERQEENQGSDDSGRRKRGDTGRRGLEDGPLFSVSAQKELRDSEESRALFEATKKKFGTTNDIREAGYILPDGTMLDFSGRHWMDEGQDTSHLAGSRSVDHREISDVGYDKDENETGFETDMSDFINRGAIRVHRGGNYSRINLSMEPTPEQYKVLRRFAAGVDNVDVDYGDGNNTDHFAQYEGAWPSRVLGDIDRYFTEGIKSTGDTLRFSVSDGVEAFSEEPVAFDRFVGDVFASVPVEVRSKIVQDAMRKYDNDFSEATKVWLASLADDDAFGRVPGEVWKDIKQKLAEVMKSEFVDGMPSDNEARYLLWRGSRPLEGVFDMADDAVMRDRLGIQEVADDSPSELSQGSDGVMFSMTMRDRAIVRDEYERMVSSGRNQWVEAMQDSMLSLKKLMQAFLGSQWTKIEDIPINENPYIAENLMSSVTAAQQQAYHTEFMKPLFEEIARLCKGGRRARNKARQQLIDYMMAKHGLERNIALADRDAKETAANGGDYNQAYAENRERDYAGLTALTGETDVHAAEAKAQQMVDDYERDHDVTELWAKVNAATNASLEKQYKSGILSFEQYQNIAGMFKFYIPLRGWDETTSDEVYGYLTSKAGPFLGGSIMKRAEGRTSKADDPIATIAKLGDDSIRTGNRNLMKQRFLTFVQNHPSDAVSVNDLWLQFDDVRNEWVPVFADIDPADDAATVEQKVQAFEQQMRQLAQAEPNKYKHGRDTVGIPYRVIPGMEREHQVLVKRNGQTYVLTINGNPRAAQALNGLTNPDVPVQGWVGSVLRGSERVNRMLSALYTTLSPAFIVSNFLRDSVYSNSMVWVKENPRYALTFHLNFGKVNPAYLGNLLRKWDNGTLDESKPMEKYFKQFMLHGGETGFAMVQDVEDYKKKVQKELKDINSKNVGKKIWNVLASQYERAGRAIENCARFAAFVTSMQMGRDVERAAYDAKEISVNFNKKGAGAKTWQLQGQTLPGNVGAFVSGAGRSLFTFWNAGVQGMTNLGRGFKRHPIKGTFAVLAPLYAAGFFAPILAAIMGAAGGGDGDDEDKNAYYNLPEYVRRSNLCIYLGGLGKYLPETWRGASEAWLTIPLPIEFRAIYGLGELTYGAVTGNEHYSNGELAMQVASQFSQLLPIDMLEGGGGLHPFIPTLLKPIVEANQNVGWSGLPIYKSDKYPNDEFKPEYTKAFSNTNEWIVGASEWSNRMTGGDEYKKGWFDWNPAKLEYMMRGYLGGIYTTIDEMRRAGETAFGDRPFEWRNVPLANRILKQGDERAEAKALKKHYRMLEQEYKETNYLLKGYESKVDEGVFEYARKLDFLHNSKEYGHYLIISEFKNIIDAYMNAAKEESDPAVIDWLEQLEVEQMRQLVKMINESDNGKDVDPYGYAQEYLRGAYDSAPDNNIKKELGKSMVKTYGGRDGFASSDTEYNQAYVDLRNANDIDEDMKLQAAKRAAKEVGDDDLYNDINKAQKELTTIRSGKKGKKKVAAGLGEGGNDQEIMDRLRKRRKELMDELGIR